MGACGYVLKDNLLELRHWFQGTSEPGINHPTELPITKKAIMKR